MQTRPNPPVSALRGAAILVAVFLAAGCANPAEPDAEMTKQDKSPAEMSREERIELRKELMAGKAAVPAPVPASDETPLSGEVPQALLERIMADLEGRTGAPRSEFLIERAGAVQWNDGSLGCPQPGQVYTQAIVPGYQVVLRHGETSYDYHAAERGFLILCEDGRGLTGQIGGKKKGPQNEAPNQ